MNLVKGIIRYTAGKLTGEMLTESVSNIQINKSTSIQILALNSTWKTKVHEAKEYLETRCANTGSYIDNETGLAITRIDKTRVTVKSDRIQELEAMIKKEVEKIKVEEARLVAKSRGNKITTSISNTLKKLISNAVIKRTKYGEWKLVK